MVKKKNHKVLKNNALLVLTACVAVAAGLVLAWMLGKEVYLAQTKSVQESKQNIVVNTIGAPKDLVDTLLAEKSGCESTLPKNVDYIERFTSKFALIKYGCSLDAQMFYKKVDGKWVSLSPTNNFVNDMPLCAHLKEFMIPASFQATCVDGVPVQGSLPMIKANPVQSSS